MLGEQTQRIQNYENNKEKKGNHQKSQHTGPLKEDRTRYQHRF